MKLQRQVSIRLIIALCPTNGSSNRRSLSAVSDVLPSATSGPKLCLVFEGGAFVYPGIDLGFTRTIVTDDMPVSRHSIKDMIMICPIPLD